MAGTPKGTMSSVIRPTTVIATEAPLAEEFAYPLLIKASVIPKPKTIKTTPARPG